MSGSSVTLLTSDLTLALSPNRRFGKDKLLVPSTLPDLELDILSSVQGRDQNSKTVDATHEAEDATHMASCILCQRGEREGEAGEHDGNRGEVPG
jgi:hypothetical protein